MKFTTHTHSVILSSLVLAFCFAGHGSSHRRTDLNDRVSAARAICRGEVLSVRSFRDPGHGRIYTRAVVRVLETCKGRFPDRVQLVHRGGVLGTEGEFDGHAPRLRVGEERLFFLSRRTDGTLVCANGGIDAIPLHELSRSAGRAWVERVRASVLSQAEEGGDVTDQAATLESASVVSLSAAPGGPNGLLVDDRGISARFLQPDRGGSIPYLVDADHLPAGLTVERALQAVDEAMAAWAEATSVSFEFAGLESFGMAAANVAEFDGILRLQLHDFYNYILGSSALGIGGRGYFSNVIEPAGWATGGNVAGYEFHQATRGYVIMRHTASALEDPATFTETLCHEIGHALSADHSSEDPDETDPELREAIMFARAHADGRGASLGSWDVDVIRQVYPPDNTPPFSFPRILDVTTDFPDAPDIAGVNEIRLHGYDLQSAQGLSLATTNYSDTGGTFSLSGDLLRYVPDGFISAERLPPAENSFYDRIHVRYSDGTNASPPISVRVVSFNSDTRPSPAGDGIPDNWMILHFGNPDPEAGTNRGAEDDADGDGLTNREEYQLGTDPTDANSKLAFTSITTDRLEFLSSPYLLYEVQETSDLQTWATLLPPILPTNSTAAIRMTMATNGVPRYYRILKVP